MRYRYKFEDISGKGGIYLYSDYPDSTEEEFDIDQNKLILVKLIDTETGKLLFDAFKKYKERKRTKTSK